MNTCKTCTYWLSHFDAKATYPDYEGECHRFPYKEYTREDHWCGDILMAILTEEFLEHLSQMLTIEQLLNLLNMEQSSLLYILKERLEQALEKNPNLLDEYEQDIK